MAVYSRARAPSAYLAALLTCAALSTPAGARGMRARPAPASVPTPAAELIKQVHLAASKRDPNGLRPHMTPQFAFSLVGGSGPDLAIAEWRRHPEALRELARVTDGPCGVRDDGGVECPLNPDDGYRAGFMPTPTGWKMQYFLKGG